MNALLRLPHLFGLAAFLGLTAAACAQTGTPVSGTPLPAEPARPVYAYTQETLLADLSRQLADQYRATGDLQLELLRPWTPPAPAAEPLSVALLEAPSALSANLLLRVRYLSGQHPVGEASLLVRVQLLREVWLTRSPVERGDLFNPNDLDTRRVDVLRDRETVTTADTNGELSFIRSVPAGRLLTWRDVARRALVRRGQVIEVAAVDGALSINMKAMAMENGSAGETVRVRNLESRKEFTALVVAESRAQVHF